MTHLISLFEVLGYFSICDFSGFSKILARPKAFSNLVVISLREVVLDLCELECLTVLLVHGSEPVLAIKLAYLTVAFVSVLLRTDVGKLMG